MGDVLLFELKNKKNKNHNSYPIYAVNMNLIFCGIELDLMLYFLKLKYIW